MIAFECFSHSSEIRIDLTLRIESLNFHDSRNKIKPIIYKLLPINAGFLCDRNCNPTPYTTNHISKC